MAGRRCLAHEHHDRRMKKLPAAPQNTPVVSHLTPSQRTSTRGGFFYAAMSAALKSLRCSPLRPLVVGSGSTSPWWSHRATRGQQYRERVSAGLAGSHSRAENCTQCGLVACSGNSLQSAACRHDDLYGGVRGHDHNNGHDLCAFRNRVQLVWSGKLTQARTAELPRHGSLGLTEPGVNGALERSAHAPSAQKTAG